VNNAQKNPYIAIEGVIGVGKTSLGRLLQPHFSAHQVLEAFDENPFLSDFYGDRARYAFQTQIFFLLSRYRQQQRIPQLLESTPIIADYCFAKDRLFAQLNLTGDELTMYERVYEALAEKTVPPDLIIYLRASTDTLMGRIALRDRSYERQMERGYIEALRRGYEQLFAAYDGAPVLVIETDEIDFVRHPHDLDDVARRIQAALDGVRQPPLPDLDLTAARHLAWQLPDAAPLKPSSEANWQALGDFIALVEAVGEIGSALAQQPPIGPEGAPNTLHTALTAAQAALALLATRTNISLHPPTE